MQFKEILVPVSVPWQISPSVPHLKIHVSNEGKPVAATFIGFFKCETALDKEKDGLLVVNSPDVFVCSDTAEGSRHRLVQVAFKEGLYVRKVAAFSDLEVIPEENYDWSQVPSGLNSGETVEESVGRVHNMWVSTGYCPDPCMYEVQGSKWLTALQLDWQDWHHYILLGHDDYVEVIARGWEWKPGQAVV
ncbi:hypothetical protein ACUHMQ_20450 [Chitinimonas sp. PSY-7]|uniref:hypothetical protein n=1 Tax=Chitinimonas sp. PSY-7 TaxID=3459088 RepID=UPI004040080D